MGAFRSADRGSGALTTPVARPSRRQTIALLAVLLIVAGTVTAVSALVRPDRARSFSLFHGSLLLADSVAPVSLDLATGRPTVRLIDAGAQVGATNSADLAVTPLQHGTLLYDRDTGEFNVAAETGFVVKTDGGVPIARRAGATGTTAVSSGDLAYLLQTGTTGTSVYLVGQATVESARSSTTRVRPRGFASFPQPVSTDPGATASAAGALWALSGSGATTRTVRQLQVPAGSSTGATLRDTVRGRVDGPAALEASGATVGIASADRVALFAAGSGSALATLRFPAVAGVDAVLAVTSPAGGRLTFLLHGTAGWRVVSVGTGAGGGMARRGPMPLVGLAGSAALAAPAQGSDGDLYTIDRASGALYRIAPGSGRVEPVSLPDGSTRYPLARLRGAVVEPGGFTDATVVARGPRVVVNSPSHLDALVLFTDGSRPPRTVTKSSAVAVNAASGVESLTRSRLAGGTASTAAPQAAPKPKSDPVNNAIDCRTTRQKPHLPTIVAAVPGSRSVLLSWTYPLLSPQDCAPSTYVVSLRTLSVGAPGAPSDVRVQGQQSVNLAGLSPSTRYAVSVTAYLNGVGTESAPQLVTTGPEGPSAARQVRVTTGAGAGWQVSWASCGTASARCVPATAWRVVPQFCDGQGLSGAPAPITVTADPSSVAQPAATLGADGGLLGRGLQFQVEGIGVQGTVGDPSAATACATSWAPPVASELSLHASTAPLTDLTGTTSAAVTLGTGADGDAERALGGAGATIRYDLTSGGATIRSIGPTTDTSVTLGGIGLDRRYQLSAVVTPPGHPEAAVTVGPIDVQPATAPWPDLTVTTAVDDTSDPTHARVTLQLHGLASADARGETFDLVDSVLQCGSAGVPLERTGFDPATPFTVTVDRTRNLYGQCSARLQLRQSPATATTPPLFGDGTTSGAAVTGTFTIAAPALPALGDVTVTAAWDGSSNGSSLVAIRTDSPLASYGQDFAATVTAPDGTTCGGYSGSDTLRDVAVDQSCVSAQGTSGTGWTVTVTHATYAGADHGPYVASGIDGGQAPTYAPPVCDVSGSGLTAEWTGTAAQPAVVVRAADASRLADCSGWTVSVLAPGALTCATETGTAPPVTLAVGCAAAPAAGTWQVQAQYSGVDGSAQPPLTVSVNGTPP